MKVVLEITNLYALTVFSVGNRIIYSLAFSKTISREADIPICTFKCSSFLGILYS